MTKDKNQLDRLGIVGAFAFVWGVTGFFGLSVSFALWWTIGIGLAILFDAIADRLTRRP
jgi:hypothetical protein